MLNGVAPILIFYFPPGSAPANALAGIPLIGSTIASFGVPIPIYLDENITGIVVDSETRDIDIETVAQPRNDGQPPLIDQRGVNSTVNIHMFAQQDSVILTALLALSDIIFTKVVQKNYSVSYLNGSTLIFNGLLHGFSTNKSTDNDLVKIQMVLSKANQASTQPPSSVPTVTPVVGATPLGGS